MGRIRTSLRGDRRAGTPSWAGAGSTVRLSAGYVMDIGRGRAWRLRSRLCHSSFFCPARWQIPHRDGSRRNWPCRRICYLRRCDQHCGDPARSCGVGRGQRAEIKSVGNIYHCHDNPHSFVNGDLSPSFTSGKGAGIFGARIPAGAVGHIWRPVGLTH